MCLSKNILRHLNCLRCKCVKIGSTIAASLKWVLTVRTILEPSYVYHKMWEDFKCLSWIFFYLGCVMMFFSDNKQSTGNIPASSHCVLLCPFPYTVNVMNWTTTTADWRVRRGPWDSRVTLGNVKSGAVFCFWLFIQSFNFILGQYLSSFHQRRGKLFAVSV